MLFMATLSFGSSVSICDFSFMTYNCQVLSLFLYVVSRGRCSDDLLARDFRDALQALLRVILQVRLRCAVLAHLFRCGTISLLHAEQSTHLLVFRVRAGLWFRSPTALHGVIQQLRLLRHRRSQLSALIRCVAVRRPVTRERAYGLFLRADSMLAALTMLASPHPVEAMREPLHGVVHVHLHFYHFSIEHAAALVVLVLVSFLYCYSWSITSRERNRFYHAVHGNTHPGWRLVISFMAQFAPNGNPFSLSCLRSLVLVSKDLRSLVLHIPVLPTFGGVTSFSRASLLRAYHILRQVHCNAALPYLVAVRTPVTQTLASLALSKVLNWLHASNTFVSSFCWHEFRANSSHMRSTLSTLVHHDVHSTVISITLESHRASFHNLLPHLYNDMSIAVVHNCLEALASPSTRIDFIRVLLELLTMLRQQVELRALLLRQEHARSTQVISLLTSLSGLNLWFRAHALEQMPHFTSLHITTSQSHRLVTALRVGASITSVERRLRRSLGKFVVVQFQWYPFRPGSLSSGPFALHLVTRPCKALLVAACLQPATAQSPSSGLHTPPLHGAELSLFSLLCPLMIASWHYMHFRDGRAVCSLCFGWYLCCRPNLKQQKRQSLPIKHSTHHLW